MNHAQMTEDEYKYLLKTVNRFKLERQMISMMDYMSDEYLKSLIEATISRVEFQESVMKKEMASIQESITKLNALKKKND